jgi:prevent-host-death family protein
MQTLPISKFKATCLSVLERVRQTGEPVLVTRFGKPVAQVVPPPETQARRLLGDMVGTGEIRGDIVGPAADEGEWEALAD